ncbi:MAG: hypothetical protein WA071_02245 [Undibacterium umbellatum]|uniref:hypothetical protein n=1 Tax=Undibacterium umbellatum TaxID=2762300 RepID=UPI003BB7AC4B
MNSNGAPSFDGWSSVCHPTSMNDDALDLWRLGKRAFESLNSTQKIESKEEFDLTYKMYRETVRQLRLTFAEIFENHPNNINFVSLDGDKVAPDFEEASDSVIVDIAWQTSRSQLIDCRFLGEMFLFVCIDEIENSIIGMCLDGRYAVSGALSAAEAFSNFQAIDSGNENLQKVRSEFASRSAIERHKRDPKQKAKSFIKECWSEWQEKPARYNKQSEFVIDVLSKIETNESGEPIVSFDTVLKKWIPNWTKEKK